MKIEQPSVIITLETEKDITEFRYILELVGVYSREQMPILNRLKEYFYIGDK